MEIRKILLGYSNQISKLKNEMISLNDFHNLSFGEEENAIKVRRKNLNEILKLENERKNLTNFIKTKLK